MILEIKGYMAKSASDSNEIEMKGKGDQSEETSEHEVRVPPKRVTNTNCIMSIIRTRLLRKFFSSFI